MIVLKDKDLPSVNGEFETLCSLTPENRYTFITGKDRDVRQKFRWVEDISYTDTNHKEHCLCVVECLETKSNSGGNLVSSKFKWITNIKVTKSRVVALANEATVFLVNCFFKFLKNDFGPTMNHFEPCC